MAPTKSPIPMIRFLFPFFSFLLAPLHSQSQPPRLSTAHFEDRASTAGITFKHFSGASPQKYLVETMGSGVALIDYDRDGWLDIYFVNGAGNPARGVNQPTRHALYRNLGNGKFLDVTSESGVAGYGRYGTGVAVGDIDNDGWPDLFVAHFGPNVLYRNLGNGTFSDVSRQAGVDDPFWGQSAGFFDLDNDGYLDLYVTNYLDLKYETHPVCGAEAPARRSYCDPEAFAGVADRLYRNRGDGTFDDISERSGIANPEGKGLGVVMADIDTDGWMDIYVANDKTRNFLFKNNGDLTYTDISYFSLTGFNAAGEAEAGMGTDFGDFDGDGLLDIVVTNYDLETNGLYRNLGQEIFSDDRWVQGVAKASIRLLGFGTGFFDYDNDGDLDLFVANGHVLDDISSYRNNISYSQPNQLLENRAGRFYDVSRDAGPALRSTRVSRGAAFGDFDNDGDIDLVVTNIDDSPELLVNQSTPSGNWISLHLVGRSSNRSGVGSRVRVVAGEKTRLDQMTGGGSYLSAHDMRMHFGLDRNKFVDLIEISWPSGVVDRLEQIQANQVVVVEEGSSNLKGEVDGRQDR